MTGSPTYTQTRSRLETYFDRTAVDAWRRLTSDAPVGRIRATVRAGRDSMRTLLLSWLPEDLRGARVLDAGCGTGALAVEAARRGAEVLAIDISPTLIGLARERSAGACGAGYVEFRVGDMLDPVFGRFDHIVAMDSLIHYAPHDAADAASSLVRRARGSLVFTFAPRTPALAAMHAVGRLFPRGDRAPAIEPVTPDGMHALLETRLRTTGRRLGRTQRVSRGFYTSQAQEVSGS